MDWEFQVLNYIRNHFTNKIMDAVMSLFSMPGTVVALWGLITLIALIIRKHRPFGSPSGHTFFAFSSATICFIYNKPFGIAMYMLSACIAFSRLYLYVHFPTDVLFGVVFGVLTALEVYYLEKHFLCDGVPLKKRKCLPRPSGN